MLVPLSILAGVVLALGLVRVAGRRGPDVAERVYAAGLLAAALIYVGLALAVGAGARWVTVEALGVALYGGVAWLGLRRRPAALALGWAAHVGWDVMLHIRGAAAAFTPAWYPWLCVGFDLVLAGAVAAQGGRHRAAARRRAA